ncbi:DUF397 domain-containing protein [Streptomyces sp. NPDC050161]|uniref:DUF397 domain-containing protein n=1 Tax=Streptomyces sp. NPDC050161 TaxID=3365604 RepID=UPI0037AB5EBA
MPEIVSAFRKSSYSTQDGNCVEVARTSDDGRAVRDSKNPSGTHLLISAGAWGSFVETLKSDDGAAF